MTAPGPASPISAARFVLSVEGTEVTFSGLAGISSAVEPAQDTFVSSSGTAAPSSPFGKASPPAVTLTRRADGSTGIWAWHMAVLAGNPGARKTCTLKLQDASGQAQLTFVLQNARPGRIDIAGLQPGQPQVVTETDQFVCDLITMQPG